MFDVQMTHRNTQELLNIAQCTSYDAYSQYEVWSLHVSVFSLHEDTHDHADVCTAAVGTAVERSHSVRTTHKSERVRMALPRTLHAVPRLQDGKAAAQLNSVKSTPSLSTSCSGVTSYGALGHVPPRLLTILFLVHFGVHLTANYPSIV